MKGNLCHNVQMYITGWNFGKTC